MCCLGSLPTHGVGFVSAIEKTNVLFSQMLINPGLDPGGFVELWV